VTQPRAAVLAGALLGLAACGPLRGAITTSTSQPGHAAPATVPVTTLPPPLALTTTSVVVETAPPPTQPPFTAAPGLSVVDALRLGEGGLGRARFGVAAADAEAYVRSVLGPPDADTDWGDPVTEFGRCPGTTARVQRWGQLILIYTDRSRYGDGRLHFSGWRYGPDVNPDALYPELLAMSNGLAPGAALADVEALYPGALQVSPATDREPVSFRVGTSFGGSLTGADPAAVVSALEAGQGCER
jgi:hypothetical protein